MPTVMIAAGGATQAAMLAIFAQAGLAAWRVSCVGSMWVAFITLQRLVIRKTRAGAAIQASLVAVSVGAQIMVVVSAALTGGVHSPFLPTLALPAAVSLLVFGPIPVSRWIAIANGLLIIAMIALPSSVAGAALPDVGYTLGVVLQLGWSMLVLHSLASKLARAAALAGESYACLREERVADVEARLRRLQSVGAKVAHELKNPLAAIKGLCQLIARTPTGERTLERLVVVEAEIIRMETILYEYLSFSRPLEDLKPETFDLATLAGRSSKCSPVALTKLA